MFIKYNFFIKILIIFFVFITFINFCYAGILTDDAVQDIREQAADGFNKKAGYAPIFIGDIIAKIIKGFLALLGVIFIILILIAGYNWMTAAGDEEKVRKAKDTIQRAIIGLLIIVSAYAITYFVFKYMPWGGGSGPPAS